MYMALIDFHRKIIHSWFSICSHFFALICGQDRQEGVAPPDACCFGLARLGREDQAWHDFHDLHEVLVER